MKRFFGHCAIFVIILVGASLSALGQTDKEPGGKDPLADQLVRQLSAAEVVGFLEKDRNALADLWSDDFVVTNPLNKFVTKQQVLGMLDSGFLVITSYERQIDYLRFFGDTAIMAGSEQVTWGGKMPNAGKKESLRYTAVWMKQGGRWREFARHANVVPQP